MKVAVPNWQGRVSPVFDVAEQVLLVDFDSEEDGTQCTERLGTTEPHQRARRLADLGVDVLVCGAISWPLEAMLAANGIRVVPLVCGEVTEVVRAFRNGTLETEQFTMPGCCCKRRRGRGRHRRRGGGGESMPEETV